MFKFLFKIALVIIIFFSNSYAENISKIVINGNDRITDEYILIFSEISLNEITNDELLNTSLKKLYETGYFDDVKFDFKNGILRISVIENPIIQSLIISGIKSKKINEPLNEIVNLKSRSSFTRCLR